MSRIVTRQHAGASNHNFHPVFLTKQLKNRYRLSVLTTPFYGMTINFIDWMKFLGKKKGILAIGQAMKKWSWDSSPVLHIKAAVKREEFNNLGFLFESCPAYKYLLEAIPLKKGIKYTFGPYSLNLVFIWSMSFSKLTLLVLEIWIQFLFGP